MSEHLRRSAIFWALAALIGGVGIFVTTITGPAGCLAVLGPSLALGVWRGMEIAEEETP